MRIGIFVVALAFVAGCAGFQDAMTPSFSVSSDAYSGVVTIDQPPVNAAQMGEHFHVLGFDWRGDMPDSVFVTAGVQGIENVMGLHLKADGVELSGIDEASSNTEYGDWSTRRFVMPLSEFERLENAGDVRLRIDSIDTYSVSSFSVSGNAGAVAAKIKPFLAAIRQHRSR